MKLYGSLTSPFVRKCRITALEVGVSDQIDFIKTNVMDQGSTHPNPLKMVPSLTTEAGELIVDSRVICAYLASLGADTGPTTWADQTCIGLSDGLMDRAVAITMELRRPENERSAIWIDRCNAAIRATVSELSHRAPDSFTPGAIALTCALGYLDFRHDRLKWRNGQDGLAAWYAAQCNHHHVIATEHPR